MKQLLARFAIPVLLCTTGTAIIDSISPVKVEAASGCGLAQYSYEGRAWCHDLNQSLNEWVRVWIRCSGSGSTIFYGPKVYLDGGSLRYRYSGQACGLFGTVSAVGAEIGYG